MLAKVITLHFDPLTGVFEDASSRDFLKDKKSIHLREYFFQFHGTAYLAVFVTYENSAMEIPPSPKNKEEDWREQIGENELPLFNAMRDWRKQRCKEDGIPPYGIIALGVRVETGSSRVLRGGSWNNNGRNRRSANRNNWQPENRNHNLGFRLLSTIHCLSGPVYGRGPRANRNVQTRIPLRKKTGQTTQDPWR